MTITDIITQVQKTPLTQRLESCLKRLDRLTGDNALRMSVPVSPDDDDIFITVTLRDAITALESLDTK